MCIEKGGENRWGGFFHGPGYGLRLSAVLDDASADALVVLKEATATQNFPAGRQAAAMKKKTFAGELRQTGKSGRFVLLLCACLFVVPTAASAAPLRSPCEDGIRRVFDAPAALGVSKGALLGGVAPHHDLALDMIVRFYRVLAKEASERGVRRVFLFAPDHFRRARRWVAACPADWGTVSADRAAVEALAGSKIVETNPELFAAEHGITLHIPLIARFFPDASVVPIVLRPDIPNLALLMLRNRLRRLLGEGDLLILSMDLSHYKPPEAMAREDERTLAALTELRPFAASVIDVDAKRAATLVLTLFRDMGATKGEILEHTDSSALLGKRVESGTSYATVIYRAEVEGAFYRRSR